MELWVTLFAGRGNTFIVVLARIIVPQQGQTYLILRLMDFVLPPLEPPSFLKGVMLQFVNVKICLFGITALTGYVTNYSTALPVLIFFEFVIATIGTAATSAWIGTGLAIQKVYLRHYRLINIILAVTLLECVYSILK